MQTTFLILLMTHISFGFTSLVSALGAMLCKKGQYAHRLCGKFFICAMTGVFITAIPMSIIKQNLFLFLIALFSYYLAFTGWRFAKNKSGIANIADWTASSIMLMTGFCMLGFGIYHFDSNDYQKIISLVFGIISIQSAARDLQVYMTQKETDVYRITKHLSAMLGATIAATTAFVVTNIHFQPEILLWLTPTILISPVIIYWKSKVRLNA